jgi:peptidoglycan/xylan/chitin deacetylase (PgdA/CDA1 family)
MSSNEVVIALTLDDGPHAGGEKINLTRRINETLKNRRIAAGFFVQAQVPYRFNSTGEDVIRELYRASHSIQIHTGSPEDHELYTKRVAKSAYDINGDKKVDAQDGLNALHSDMKYAKKAINAAITKGGKNAQSVPRYARAPTGMLGDTNTKKKILDTLKSEDLAHVFWDVDSGDNRSPRPDRDTVVKNLEGDIKKALTAKDKSYLVVLFHDINPITMENLSHYITKIEMAVRTHGRVPRFTTSREELHEIFDKISSGQQ